MLGEARWVRPVMCEGEARWMGPIMCEDETRMVIWYFRETRYALC